MGIDFTFAGEPDTADAWPHWSYGGFNRMRERLCKQALGFDLDDMDGFGGSRSWSDVADDIEPLLNHSDCDGELTASECARVAPRLLELVATWGEDDYDRIHCERLAAYMQQCSVNEVSLEFC